MPQWIKTKIDKLPDFTKSEKFRNYQKGSLRHPLWPAMYSTVINISFWILIVMRLTLNQLCETKKTNYTVKYTCTIEGVHFEDDNIVGLDMSQEIIEKYFPCYREKKYGTDTEKIRSKMEYKCFEWEY